MGLQVYKRKRHFDVTSEPAGSRKKTGSGHLYIIQKHDASRLHYDFRLELDGVLKSWAVPKGPSLDPSHKVLAVQVEDHPLEYGSFEGTIPEGEYGGGTVMLWDRGTWEAIGDARKSYRDGRLKFELQGEKLRGIWNLVRMKRRAPGKDEWLLIKHQDRFARSADQYDITAKKPLSVASGKNLDEIASPKSPVWKSNRASVKETNASRKIANSARSVLGRRTIKFASIFGAKSATQPAFISPQLATLVKNAPEGDEWIHEIKLDGYRIICVIRDGKANLFSRRQNNWNEQFSEIAAAAESLPLKNVIIDGEVVAMNSSGISDFQSLQNRMRSGDESQLTYFVFDALYCDGHDLREFPLIERKKLLSALLSKSKDKRIRYHDHIVGQGPEMFKKACRLGVEGIVSKRANGHYVSRRTLDWRKIKCKNEQEFVIGGYTDPSGARTAFGALLLGYYDQDGSLHYAGRVGTGFNESRLMELGRTLKRMEIVRRPFADAPVKKECHWVRPELVARIEFTEVTNDGRIRHPSFKGLREDKKPAEVFLELPKNGTHQIKTDSDSRGRNGHASKSRLMVRKRSAHRSKDSKKNSDAENVVAGIPISSPDKLLYPDDDVTKLELARYYEAVAEWMLPHIAGRPLMIVRCPEGVGAKCFYQKHMNATMPAALSGVRIKEKQKTEEHLVLKDMKGLIALAQMGVLEIHAWGCRADDIEKPDRVIFDLDPAPNVAWKEVAHAALLLRNLLREINLECFLKLSGGKGLHIVIPIARRHTWGEVESFAHNIANAFATASPDKYVANMRKAKRVGKIYLDYLRNQRGATCVAAYSSRARPGAAVSLPIAWKELEKVKSGAQFGIHDVLQRMANAPDSWRELPGTKQSLPGSGSS